MPTWFLAGLVLLSAGVWRAAAQNIPPLVTGDETIVVTRHRVKTVHGDLAYEARAGRLPIRNDETGEVRSAKVIWRRGSTIGIRLHSAAPPDVLRPCDRYALRERYYAIPD